MEAIECSVQARAKGLGLEMGPGGAEDPRALVADAVAEWGRDYEHGGGRSPSRILV